MCLFPPNKYYHIFQVDCTLTQLQGKKIGKKKGCIVCHFLTVCSSNFLAEENDLLEVETMYIFRQKKKVGLWLMKIIVLIRRTICEALWEFWGNCGRKFLCRVHQGKRIDRARRLFVILLKEQLSSIAIKMVNVFLPFYDC